MIKLNWLRGKNLGLALSYLGTMGLVQVFFIFIAQYSMQIGSKPLTILIPIVVIIATTYSIIVTFESRTSMSQYRSKRATKHKKKKKGKISDPIIEWMKNPVVAPALMISGVFAGIFFLCWLILFSWVNSATVFVIADNLGAAGALIFATLIEHSTGRRTR